MQVMIRCKLKPDQVEKCLELGRGVYDELASVRPDGCARRPSVSTTG
jgi:hypothetical protein